MSEEVRGGVNGGERSGCVERIGGYLKQVASCLWIEGEGFGERSGIGRWSRTGGSGRAS